ncbi:MAG TPA: bifunctional hydroxymethylpyrimidine kinase/phosphomethylpyrimidine kinase [Acidimicrobiales bacterium]|nr:bifunctional hydroxymethylpyrimidine kinase/phosphomethylpyrimidine kinase [Acidimicrobiales bacterium]
MSVCLTIAGSDSSGGAGLAADLRVFDAHGVRGAVAVTAVTAQNWLGVQAIEVVTPELVRAQIASVASDTGVDAAKTGMLGSAEVVEVVADAARDFGLRRMVVDPVMMASSGGRLLDSGALGVLKVRLLPLATVITPNLAEAEALVGWSVDDRATMEKAALALAELGPEAVLVTGGHLGDGASAPDCLVLAGESPQWLDAPRVPGGHAVRGTGCMLSAAICAHLAIGEDLVAACTAAKAFVCSQLPQR